MIKWILPLGFLGLLSIIALVAIYLIKPNLQQKFLSSTYIWRVMLKKRKRRVPVQPIRNIIIFLCQALALTMVALILAQPKLFTEGFVNDDKERIVIIDASANMNARFAGDENSPTRFDRAIREVKMHIDKWLVTNEGTLSIILAGKEASYVIAGATEDNYSDVVFALDELECYYGSADMRGALSLAEERLSVNPAAQIILYSGSDYGNLGSAVTVRNLANIKEEWNIGILGCDVSLQGNEYVFHVSVGAFGQISKKYILYVDIYGANTSGEVGNISLSKEIMVDVNSDSSEFSQIQYIDFCASDPEVGGSEGWYYTSFSEVEISFKELNDSVPSDDTFMVYGGERDNVRVEYYSAEQNIFYNLGFHYLRDPMSKVYDIWYQQAYSVDEIEYTGYEFYIFEHTSMESYPSDGILILSDPKDLSNFGITMGQPQKFGSLQYFTSEEPHPLIEYLKVDRMGVTSYNKIESYGKEFQPILFCNGDPVLLVRTVGQPVVIMPFSLNLSNLPSDSHLTTLLFNLIKTYLPQMLTKYDFEADEAATVNSKGSTLTVTDPNGEAQTFTGFPSEVELKSVGTYTFTSQFDYDRESEVRKAFVHIPSDESGLFRIIKLDIRLDTVEAWVELGTDLLMYLAIVLLVLSTVEWALQIKEIV